MKYATINPVDNKVVKEFKHHPMPDIDLSVKAYQEWRKYSVKQRGQMLDKVAALLSERKREYAELITLEMGKPIHEAEYEIAKVLTAFTYYRDNAAKYLKNKIKKSNASKSYISFEPLGVIFGIMPWNFPFWQVFRFAVPTLMAGNSVILKHAYNVPQCADAIEHIFRDAGLPQNLFRNYYLTNEDAGRVIADARVHGLSFTGSDVTGGILASQAGAAIKKCVMELGGNDAFIVMDDADLDKAVAGAIRSRSINSGQSCNGAKRFIVMQSVADEFTKKLTFAVQQLKVGAPMEEGTQVGPLARKDLAEKVRQQIADSVAQGATPYQGMQPHNNEGNYVTPTVLTGVKEGVRAFHEEIFGPVWSVIVVKDINEAIATANNSVYGLGASIWTGDKKKAEKFAPLLEAGNVFINDIVKSDARIPFGGIKRSGFGRELSEHGLLEFVNMKTVYIA